MSRDDGITLVAVYFFVVAGLLALGALATVLIPLIPLSVGGMPFGGAMALLIVFGLGFLVVGGLAVLHLIVGLGLLGRKEWARWLAIILSLLGLFNFPIGTVIGGLIIVFLLQDNVQEAFGRT